MNDDLDILFRLAGNRGVPEDWNDHFDPIGLILQIPPKSEEYWCTPRNAVTFARTGGGGTHFSLIAIPNVLRAHQPVVMTVPMSDDPNVIVGENLRDFLALGCRAGYFGLEGLVHQPDEKVAELERAQYDDDAEDRAMRMLQVIETTFGLQPWANPKKRLAELKLRFYPTLKLPPPT
jgi:hypothetical protein